MSAMVVGGALATHLWKRLAALALATVSLAALGLLTAPAHAQEDCNPGPSEPYSGGQPPCTEQNRITIDLSVDEGGVGTGVEVLAQGFTVGDPVSVTFGGQPAATATATPSSDPAFSGKGAIREPITVPNVAAGTYDVCASAPNSETACAPFRVIESARVLGVRFARDDAGGIGGIGGGRGLAATGITLLAYLLAAVILILIGRFLVTKTRSRGAVDHRG